MENNIYEYSEKDEVIANINRACSDIEQQRLALITDDFGNIIEDWSENNEIYLKVRQLDETHGKLIKMIDMVINNEL